MRVQGHEDYALDSWTIRSESSLPASILSCPINFLIEEERLRTSEIRLYSFGGPLYKFISWYRERINYESISYISDTLLCRNNLLLPPDDNIFISHFIMLLLGLVGKFNFSQILHLSPQHVHCYYFKSFSAQLMFKKSERKKFGNSFQII